MPGHKLYFRESDHTYWYRERQVPSVTTIIRPLSDYSMIPKGVMERARQEGNAIHHMVEWFEDGLLDEATLPEWMRPRLAAWKKFKAEAGFETDACEKRVYHTTYAYAGTLDLAGTASKLSHVAGRGIIDLKRSLYDDPATNIQLSAYAEAENQAMPTGLRIKWRAGLKLNDDGTYRLHVFQDKSGWPTFLACLCVYKWLKEHRE